MRALLSLAFLFAFAPAAAADPPRLGLPLACDPGLSCWIANYVDHDESEGVRDYACGTATYNGGDGAAHNGTDFAIRDLAAMREGVPVLAAAAGTVAAVRDGVDDVAADSPAARRRVAGIECGNGVVVDHGDGWSTQYCHLRKGSVAVRGGDTVAPGQTLGLVGLSGFTEYPHVHLSVRKGGAVVDPFVGESATGRCGPGDAPLWSPEVMAKLPYGPTALYNAGFADEVPKWDRAEAGAYQRPLARAGAVLVVWAAAFNVREGDRFHIAIFGPDGRVIAKEATKPFAKHQARRFEFIGKRTPPEGWPAGKYVGTVRALRPKGGDQYTVLGTLTATVTIR